MAAAWVKVAPNGRLSLPIEIRRQLGVEKGGDLVLGDVEDGAVTLMTAEASVRRVQRLARELFGDRLPSVDEFLERLPDFDALTRSASLLQRWKRREAPRVPTGRDPRAA